MTTKAQGSNWSEEGSSDPQKLLSISKDLPPGFVSRNKADVSRAEQELCRRMLD